MFLSHLAVFLAIDQSLPCEPFNHVRGRYIECIHSDEYYRSIRNTEDCPEKFSKFEVVTCRINAIATLTLPFHNKYKYIKSRILFIHEATGESYLYVEEGLSEHFKIFPFQFPALCLSLFVLLRISIRATSAPTAPKTSEETRRISLESVSAGCFNGITYGVRR